MRQWISVLLRVWEDISKDRVFALAGGVAYYGLLALFPVAALVALEISHPFISSSPADP